MINDLNDEGIKFLVSKKDYCKIEKKNNIWINVFSYENDLTFPVYVSDQNFESRMDLLLIIDKNKLNYVYIKDFNRFMCNKTKNKNKKHFYKYCLQCFSSEKVLIKHKENCLIINGKQSVQLKGGSIEFKNHFKKLSVLFKTYDDFECLLKRVQSSDKMILHTLKSIKNIFLVALLTKLFVLIINSVKELCFIGEKCKL